jgi:hypothetical protein
MFSKSQSNKDETLLMSTRLVAYLAILCLTQTIGWIKQFLAIALNIQKYSIVTLSLFMKRENGQISEVVNT